MSSDKIPVTNLGAETSVPKPSREIRPEKTPDKGSNATRKGEPKGVGFGTEGQLPWQRGAPHKARRMGDETMPIAEGTLRDAVDCAVTALKGQLPKPQFKAMDRQTKKKVVSLFSSMLPSKKPGRKTSPEVLIGSVMRYQQHKFWREIYPVAFPHWHKLPPHEQRVLADNLRNACRVNKNRNRKRQAKHPTKA